MGPSAPSSRHEEEEEEERQREAMPPGGDPGLNARLDPFTND
jgi:hypothetical protein